MRIPKKYGKSKIDKCPFCQRQATTENNQGLPVCRDHKNSTLDNLKCLCGEYLDIRKGKYGIFFSCMNCGNINLRKVLEINRIHDPLKAEKREETITSDDPRYF